MFFKKKIFYWYLFIALFAIFGGSTLYVMDVISGILLLIFLYIVFAYGQSNLIRKDRYSLKLNKYINQFDSSSRSVDKKLFIYSIIAPFLSVYIARYYTGNNPTDVLAQLISGGSLYNDYQIYFEQNSINVFKYEKIPAILASAILKFFVLLSIVSIFIFRDNNIYRYCYVTIIVLSYCYFSIARGTTFEFFELIILIWYCFGLRESLYGLKIKFFSKSNLILIICIIIIIFIYDYNINSRYSFEYSVSCVTEQLCVDKNSMVYLISKDIAILFSKLSGYFTFGLYYISKFIDNIWLFDFNSFVSYLFPGNSLVNLDISEKACGIILDCGVAWKPDALKVVDNFGFITFFIIILIIGKLSSVALVLIKKQYKLEICQFFYIFFLYYLFLFMISLPVGNFVFISSSNTIISVLSSFAVIIALIKK